MMSSSKAAQSLFDNEENLIMTENGAIVSTEALTVAQNTMSLSAKAATVATKALAMAGNMLVAWAVTKGIELAVKAINNYVHRVEIAREKLEETVSELESVKSQIGDINSQIDELLAKDTITLTDENDLKRLKEENEQLKIRQAILEAQKAEDVKDLNKKIEDKYNKVFNSGTEVSTDEYGNQITLPSGEDYLKNRIAYAKELIGLNRELTEQEKLDLQSIRDYALEQGQYIMDLTEGYEAVTAEEKEQQKIWNDILADIAYLSENEAGTIPDITKRLEEKFANGVSTDMKDSVAKEDKEISKWIESLSDDDKKIMLKCDIDDTSLENLKQYLEENQKLEVEAELETSLSISQTIDQLNTQLKPAMDSIKSAWQDIFTEDGFALNDIDIISTCESIRSELDEMSELGLEIDYSAFDDFVRVLSNTESKEEDVEKAFDELATSITNAGLNGTEDFEVMKSALEDLGVVNEDIVAFQALAQNTDALKESGLDLANSSYTQIEAFAQEKLSAEDTAQGIAVLLYQQMLVVNNPLDTLASIQALANLGGKAAETAGILAELAQIMAQISNLQTWMANNPNADASLVEATLSGLQKRAESLKTKVTVGADVDYSDATKSAGSAGSKAGDAYVEAFEKELSELETLRDQGKITEKEYLDQLRVNIYAPFTVM